MLSSLRKSFYEKYVSWTNYYFVTIVDLHSAASSLSHHGLESVFSSSTGPGKTPWMALLRLILVCISPWKLQFMIWLHLFFSNIKNISFCCLFCCYCWKYSSNKRQKTGVVLKITYFSSSYGRVISSALMDFLTSFPLFPWFKKYSCCFVFKDNKTFFFNIFIGV